MLNIELICPLIRFSFFSFVTFALEDALKGTCVLMAQEQRTGSGLASFLISF